MDRRFFLTLCGGAVVAAMPALAGSFEDAVVKQLKAQGFEQITVETTLLGRVRIVAYSNAGRREIVLNPRTGEVLRDVLTAADGSVAPVIANTSGSGNSDSDGGSGSSGSGGTDDNSDSSGSGDSGGTDDSGGSGSGSSGGETDTGETETETETSDDGKDN